MRKKIVIANWKMNPASGREAEKLFNGILKSVSDIKKTEIAICPPFLYLGSLKGISKKISLGAQDSFWEDSGAFTGEVSSEMLYDIGARYVILGHSERRAMGENNLNVNKKIKGAIKSGLRPILCVGEAKRDENHEYLSFVRRELEESLEGVSKNSLGKVVVAYEPIWAIGAGAHPATAEEWREMNLFLKKILNDKFGAKAASGVRVVYGGSVDEKNARDFLEIGQADGFLVGRASLKPEKFGKIAKICEA